MNLRDRVAAMPMREAILELVTQLNGSVTFVNLKEYLGDRFLGDRAMEKPKNLIWWSGISLEFLEALVDLLRTGDITFQPTNPFTYLVDGESLDLRVARRYPSGGFKKPRWVPIVFGPRGMYKTMSPEIRLKD